MKHIDLHIHTTFSDGTYSPSEIVTMAKDRGLSAIAISDHDTVNGIEEALASGKENYLEIIPAIELSAEYQGASRHLLGYFIDYKSKVLLEKLAEIIDYRDHRNEKMIKKLNEMGYDISIDEVKKVSGGDVIARPHIAHVLIEKGYAASIDEAFDKFLGREAPAYVDRKRLYAEEAIKMVRQAGGIAVIAHPGLYKLSEDKLDAQLQEFVAYGLQGVECEYPEHDEKETELFKKYAEKYNLIITGGSDFHGFNRSDINLGLTYNDKKIDYSLLEGLKKLV